MYRLALHTSPKPETVLARVALKAAAGTALTQQISFLAPTRFAGCGLCVQGRGSFGFRYFPLV